MSPEELMDKGKLLLKSKADDYTSGDTTRYENFERQQNIMSWFKNDQDKAFVSLIAVKLARLASLLGTDKEPQHESIEDTFIDLINYSALWGGYRTKYTGYKGESAMPGHVTETKGVMKIIQDLKNSMHVINDDEVKYFSEAEASSLCQAIKNKVLKG